MEREGDPFGLFLSAYEPTRSMKAEVAAAGVHENDFGRFPRLQILTPADLFYRAPAGRFRLFTRGELPRPLSAPAKTLSYTPPAVP